VQAAHELQNVCAKGVDAALKAILSRKQGHVIQQHISTLQSVLSAFHGA